MGQNGNNSYELARNLAEVYLDLRRVNSRELGCGYEQCPREIKISMKRLEKNLRNRESAMSDVELMTDGIIEEIQIMRLAVKYSIFDREQTATERDRYRALLERIAGRYNLDPKTFLPREQ